MSWFIDALYKVYHLWLHGNKNDGMIKGLLLVPMPDGVAVVDIAWLSNMQHCD